MNTGYSLLLGEYVEAQKVNYIDCKAFQIVCPNCKEPIFKVNREVTSTPVEYLSHYNRDKGYVAECELRVKSLSKEEMTKSNNLSRGQRLEYFLSVLQEAISTTLYPQDEASQTKVNKLLNRFGKSKSLKHYRDLLFEFEGKTSAKISDDDLEEFMQGYVDDIREVNQGEFFKTSFALETQKRIARDVWRHLLSAKAKENFFVLFHHAYYSLMSRLKIATSEGAAFQHEVIMYNAMERLIDTSTNKRILISKTLIEYPIGKPYAMEGSNLFNKLLAEIAHEMLGILLVLPYFELLKEAKNRQLEISPLQLSVSSAVI